MKSSYHEIQLILNEDEAQEISLLLDQNALDDLSGYYEVLYEENRPRDSKSTLMLYFPPNAMDSRWDLEALLLSCGIEDYSLDEKWVDQQDYLEAYKDHYRPFVVGDRFAIIPSWFKGSEDETRFKDRKPIYLDPGLAFGTGLHATTRMMIRWLEQRDLTGRSVMDAGCGSGVLTIAAFRMGATKALAFDVDGNAVNATISNLDLNFETELDVQVLKGGWDLKEVESFPADIVLANITLNTFLAAQPIVAGLKTESLVVSGIIEEQKQEFLQEFPEWALKDELSDDGWLAMEFSRR